MSEFFKYLVLDGKEFVRSYATFKNAIRAAERFNQEYGAVKYFVRVIKVNVEEKTVDNVLGL